MLAPMALYGLEPEVVCGCSLRNDAHRDPKNHCAVTCFKRRAVAPFQCHEWAPSGFHFAEIAADAG